MGKTCLSTRNLLCLKIGASSKSEFVLFEIPKTCVHLGDANRDSNVNSVIFSIRKRVSALCYGLKGL